MVRITNNLFEAIQKVTSGEEVAEASVDKAHYCATHVEHALLGYGECISEQHAEPDEEGNIAWYTVKFPTGTHKVNAEQLRVVEGKSHMHSKKMAEENIEEAEYAKATMPQKFGEAPKLKDKEDSSRPFEYAKATMPQKFGEAPKLRREEAEEIEEAEGGIPKTEKHKKLAAHYGDPNRITRGDIITAAKKNAMKKEEVEKIAEGGMPSSVIKHKQALAAKTPEQLHAGFKEVAQRTKKSVEEIARSTAWGHGYGKGEGKGSAHYWNKIKHLENKNESVDEAKNMSAFDWKSKAKSPQSKFTAKKISTGTVYTRKYKEEKDDDDDELKSKSRINKVSSTVKNMKEGITQTIINHNDFVLEVTDNPTFKDYFNAVQSIVPQSNEEIQKEIVTIATEAFNEGYTDIILESMTREGFKEIIEGYEKDGFNIVEQNYIIESENPYVEIVVEKDNNTTQFIHTGIVVKSEE